MSALAESWPNDGRMLAEWMADGESEDEAIRRAHSERRIVYYDGRCGDVRVYVGRARLTDDERQALEVYYTAREALSWAPVVPVADINAEIRTAGHKPVRIRRAWLAAGWIKAGDGKGTARQTIDRIQTRCVLFADGAPAAIE